MEEYGRHLIIDLTVMDGDRYLLTDRECCAKYLDLVSELIDMQPIFPTQAVRLPYRNEVTGIIEKLQKEGVKSETVSEHAEYIKDKKENKTGVTAFCTLSTSHASIHTWAQKNSANIDIYSCLDFDSAKVEMFTKKFFNAKEMRVTNILRHYSKPQIVERCSQDNIEESLEL